MKKQKQLNKEIREKHELEQKMLKYPDNCYCYENIGLEPIIDTNDEPIEYSKPIDGFPFPNSKEYSYPIYICKRCGKKYHQSIVYG